MSRLTRAAGFALLATALSACGGSSMTRNPAASQTDEFLWLEEVEGSRALEFARTENEKTFAALKSDSRYAGLESEVRKILLAQDRLPTVSLRGGLLYNFWQDASHQRGLWRRTAVDSFASSNPQWETVLDLDALAAAEGENWVWKGSTCNELAGSRCLLHLSRGGKDAVVIREFDTATRQFVADGFRLPEAKTRLNWVDENRLYVATDFGDGTLTDSGYPRVVKLWERGRPLEKAIEIFRGEQSDVWSVPRVDQRPEGIYRFIERAFTFYEKEISWLNEEGEVLRVPMPRTANFEGAFRQQMFFTLQEPLENGGHKLAAGTLVALPFTEIRATSPKVQTVFTPTATRVLETVRFTKNYLLLDVLDNVKGRILKAEPKGKSWNISELSLGGNGVAAVTSTEPDTDLFLASYSDFLTPTTTYYGDASPRSTKRTFRALKSAPARFDAAGLVAEQKFATSKDGTRVPYFLVGPKNLVKDGKNPTILYGYGGFLVPLTPAYGGVNGKAWLERGGVYALANIRGGGEYGPAWHRAALKENRQRAFDDFLAVAEDLVRSKITSPAHLGIQGGSNGGLLVGAAITQRPDLFGAALCEVPLLDMLRYHRLLAGASWMAEYGDPEIPAEREYIARYSPFQNVKPEATYPEVFFLTSTKDDRVHPGHARRMVARMKALGKPVLYYENTEGGHGGAANLEQRVLWSALEYTYLWRTLARDSGHTHSRER